MIVPMNSLGVIDGRLDDGLIDRADLALGPVGRVGDDDLGVVLLLHPVHDVRRRRDQVEVEFAFQALAGDLHVQQTQKSATETEAERHRGLGFVGERGIVELQPLQRVTQVGIIGAVDGIQPRVHHRLGFAVSGQRLRGPVPRAGDGVTDLRLAHIFHTGDQVTDLAHAEADGGLRLGRDDAHLQQLVGGASGHHRDLLARGDLAVHHSHVGDHAAVDVVDGVENHCARGRFRVSGGRRHLTHHVVEQFGDALPRLARHAQDVARLATDDVGDLARHSAPGRRRAGRSC